MALNNILNKTIADTNIGGLSHIYFLPIDIIESLPLTGPVDLSDVMQIGAVVSGRWCVAEFIRGTARFSEEPALGPNGPYVKIKISFKVAMHHDDRIGVFSDMRERKYCVAAYDNNNYGRLIGEINLRGERNGMTFHEESTSGETEFNRNEYAVYFYAECRDKARVCYSSGEITLEGGGVGGGTGGA